MPERYLQTAVITMKLYYLYVTGKIQIVTLKATLNITERGVGSGALVINLFELLAAFY